MVKVIRHSLAAVALALALTLPASARGMEPIEARGPNLYAGSERFVATGFNYDTLGYFDNPGPSTKAVVLRDFAQMRARGINTMRIFLELPQVMRSPKKLNTRTLRAYNALLRMSEALGVRLIVTGNVIFRPESERPWYDGLSEPQRWKVQARFWRAVAKRAWDSPAILSYELTSEPVVPSDGNGSTSWYTGEFLGYHFVQYLARGLADRDPAQIVRVWCGQMRDAIREYDENHLISVGLLPFRSGALGPAMWAGCLDFLTVHEYTYGGELERSKDVVRAFAAQGKPVVLGETYPADAYLDPWMKFLLWARPYLDGYMSHWKSTGWDEWWLRVFKYVTDGFLELQDALKG